MKELSSALSCKRKDSIKVSEALAKSSADLYCELAEQVLGIKDILEYETLFSEAQIDVRAALDRLCSTVNHFVEILESRLHLPRLAIKRTKNLKRGKYHTSKDHKRPKLVHPTKEDRKLEESEDEKMKKASTLMEEKFDGLCKVMKEVLGSRVENVVVSEHVVESSSSLRDSSLAGYMSNEETIEISSSKLVFESVVESSCVLRDSSMGRHMSSKKTMEINPENTIMEELRKRSDADMNDKFVRDLSLLLFETASLTSGCGLTRRKSLAVSQGYTSQEEPEEEMGVHKQSRTNDNRTFYIVGVVTVVEPPYAGPDFFKKLPADIRNLLQKFPKCETIEDLEIAMSKHRNGLIEPECLLSDLEKELKALKELSSALDCKYESCINNFQELGMSSAVVYRELVEQFPGIKDMKECGTLFTTAQRFSIEKALEAKLRKNRVTTVNLIPFPQGAPEISLREFQTKLLDNENKSLEESNRRKILVRLRSTVKYSAKTLESRLDLVADKQTKKRKGCKDYSGEDSKRIRLVWPTREGRKLEESGDGKKKAETSKKEKFEDVCKVIKEVLGDRIEKVVVSECVAASSWFSKN